MNKKIITIIICTLTLLLCGCKCNKCSKVTNESIKKDYPYFDITLNINNESYQIIKAKNGYLYNNKDKDALIFYDYNNEKYYEIDEENKTKTLLNDNYNLDNYINNIYYVLSYYVEKDSKKGYQIEETSYLEYDVNIYKKQSLNYSEEIIVVNKQNICLGFNIKSDTKSINAKIEKINFDTINLSKYDDYTEINNISEQIMKAYENYNIEIYIDGVEYKFVKSTNGYYYESLDGKFSLYYDIKTNNYYTVDNKSKTKTIINGDYSLDSYINNINYVLLYHLDKELLIAYEKKQDKYLGRNVTKYTYSGNYNETIIVDNETNSCLLFELKSDNKQIVGKINNITFEDINLDYLNQYQTLKKCDEINFKTKEEIINQFTFYSITLIQEENIVKMIKNEKGFVCLISDQNNTTGVLYDQEKNIWYDILGDSEEKYISENEYKISEYEDNIFSLLTNHIDYVNNKFYKLENQKYIDRDVTIFIRNSAINNTLYKQEFIVDNITGVCLKQDLNVNGLSTNFYIENLANNGSIDEFLNYKEVYYSWPENHKYLEDINEIEYGTLVKGFEDIDGLNLYYKDINNSFFNQILKDIIASGYTYEAEQEFVIGDDQLYTFYMYTALNDKGLNIRLEFDGKNKTLSIIINETIR